MRFGKFSRNGLMGNAEPNFPDIEKVNSLGPKSPLLIAFHSPNAMLETGLRMCPPEKKMAARPSMPSIPFSAVRFAWE
jgi:hypothetical protein